MNDCQWSPSRARARAAWLGVLVAVVTLSGNLHAQELGDDFEFRPGLIARFTGKSGARGARVDPEISFRWEGRPPDPRIGADKFKAQWSGLLFIQTAGKHEFLFHLAGRAQLKIDNKKVVESERKEPGWAEAEPLELEFGFHAIAIDFEATAKPELGLFWSGPNFGLEPVPSRLLFHDPEQTPSGEFERGRLLSWALRCNACHEIPASQRLPAPALDKLPGNLSPAWLRARLAGDSQEPTAIPGKRRMPHFDLAKEEAEAIAAYLLSPTPKKEPKTRKASSKDVDAGARLFFTLGCLACHTHGKLGQGGLFGGGDLTLCADKRPADFFARWLEKPDTINQHRRMPIFRLSGKERLQLAAYLSTLASKRPDAGRIDFKLAERGKQLVLDHHCGACHALPGKLEPPKVRAGKLNDASNWQASCLAGPDQTKHRPGYRLQANDQKALRVFVSTMAARAQPARAAPSGEVVLAERNCLSCHARGFKPGLAGHLPEVVKGHAKLAPQLPALTPPSLNSVGDKLEADALRTVIREPTGEYRPWLLVRMPRFNLSDDELNAVVQYLIEKDRIPAHPERTFPASSALLHRAGRRLVTSDGFGCTSCHAVGKVEPPKAPLGARGPQLLLLEKRIRRDWFDRWVRNPARIVPRMEMPAVQVPVMGVLDDKIERQLAAVWTVLNDENFVPPRPNPVRIARHTGRPDEDPRALVLTDVLQYGGRRYIKPFLVGLRNRHNVLFDLETASLAGWWQGDTARQYALGKSWLWEAITPNLLGTPAESSDFTLQRGDKILRPKRTGQFVTEIDAFAHRDHGIELEHRLHFEPAEKGGPAVLSIRQIFAPLSGGDDTRRGYRRTISVQGVPEGVMLRLRLLGAKQIDGAKIDAAGRSVKTKDLEIAVRTPEKKIRLIEGDGFFLKTPPADGKTMIFVVDYLTRQPATPLVVKPKEIMISPQATVNVVPGFDGVRLPLTTQIMPTALAWRPDGTLVVASLKGRVWLARDTNNDGIEDSIAPYSDDLAAPYGLHAHSDSIDVVTKYGLLRLFDDKDGKRAQRGVMLASGWGHTDDYHDWAVGLPLDKQGNYYLSFPCQQDKRSPAAATLRGTTVKLVPRKPTRIEPRWFDVEVLSTGHRFGMGLALDRHGELFVTDNQGNYNPYNELNHVRKGMHFGFINALDRQRMAKLPVEDPAVSIPHPWTRSVNGICFLDTPAALKKKTGKDLFGPFEGQLVGCEYDTHRLVRMSLQRVGTTIQGAAYPFSNGDEKGPAGLLGPVAAAISPTGDLYVGSMRDSGWGGGNNIGDLVRFRRSAAPLPAGIAEIRAVHDGFLIDFTAAVDARKAADVESFSISSVRRIVTSAYGGKDVDRRTEKFAVEVINPARVKLTLMQAPRGGFVYEFRVKKLTADDGRFFPAEAYYTLKQAPKKGE